MRNAVFFLSALTVTVVVGFTASTASAAGVDLWKPVEIQPIYIQPVVVPTPAPSPSAPAPGR